VAQFDRLVVDAASILTQFNAVGIQRLLQPSGIVNVDAGVRAAAGGEVDKSLLLALCLIQTDPHDIPVCVAGTPGKNREHGHYYDAAEIPKRD